MSKIARYYNAEANPDGAFIPGVGLSDVTDDQWDALPDHVKASVDASEMYRKSKPPGWKAPEPVDSDMQSGAVVLTVRPDAVFPVDVTRHETLEVSEAVEPAKEG